MTQNLQFGIRITGLPEKTKKEDLIKPFANCGKIISHDLSIRTDKLEGRVYYSQESEMYRAAWELHDTEINKKKISVTLLLKNPKELFDLFLTGHPPEATKEEIRDMITSLCQVKCIRITNKRKYCFIQIFGRYSVDRALKILDGSVTKEGYRLSVELSKKREDNTSTKELALAKILNNICKSSHILPSFSDADMHILERSQRTYHLSGMPMDSDEDSIRSFFLKYGEIESCARIEKEGFRSCYGFIVFKSHRSSDQFRQAGTWSMFLGNTMVKIAPSKPTRSVNETARAAGLMDYENNPTHLFFELMKSGLEIYEAQQSVQTTPLRQNQLLFQDTVTGQYYTMSPEQYTAYMNQQYSANYAYINEQNLSNQIQRLQQEEKKASIEQREVFKQLNNCQTQGTRGNKQARFMKKYSPY